ncbi:dipeptidase [Clostridium minihomine]|uniref:dipeptidase n=1 Tax=Clostridium minihomine TaxID=2045012 RepID=UPI001FB1F790|nr:dipeptidase [Clostridium minihomine]
MVPKIRLSLAGKPEKARCFHRLANQERRSDMSYIDLHCDTISLLLEREIPLFSNEIDVSIEKMKTSDVFCQFFAMFIRMSDFENVDESYAYLKKMYHVYQKEMEENKEHIRPALCAADIHKNRREGKLSGVLTVEEGGVIGQEMDRLEELYNMGVRLITLTWNYENSLGFPNSDDPAVMEAGLKPFGKEVVERMNDLHMLIDVSHLSDGGFWDVAQMSRGPFVASHSNSRSVRDFRRNLTDDMLRTLAEKGGVTGINFYHKFLGEDGNGSVPDMVRHIKHIKNVAGIDTIALGSDFDGFSGPCEIRNCAQFYKLADALSAAGFTDSEIEKICWKNALRVIDSVL